MAEDNKTRSENSEIFKGDGPARHSAGMPTRNVMRDDFGFEIPQESVPLPSRGVIYPQEGPLHGQETIDIKPMTAREEDILASQALIKEGTVIDHLIDACVLDKSLNSKNLILQKIAL